MTPARGADVLVVGAGVIGLAAAAELARRGAAVTVIDRGMAGSGTSSRGEGNLLVSDKEIPAEATLALRSLEGWRALAEASPEPFEYERKGGIVTAATDRQVALLAEQADRQRALGIDVVALDPAALAEREPWLRRDLAGGLWYPQDAQVMPIQAVRALARAARDAGAVVRTGEEVQGATPRPGGLVVQTTRGTIHADVVVNAAGPWAGEVARRLGGHAPVFPRRGLLLVTEPVVAGTVRHKVYDGRYVEAVASDDADAQVAPVIESTLAGTLLLGSTREVVGWDQRVRWDLVGALAREATALFPGFAALSVIRLYQGFRPASPDHLPLIGPDARVEGLVHATGHEGAGIGLAPGTAELVADVVLDGRVEPAFDPRRIGVGVPGPAGVAGSAGVAEPAGVAAPARAWALGALPGGTVGRLPAPARPGVAELGAPTSAWSTPAAASLGADRPSWRTTRGAGAPRGLFCGIGHCHDCLATAPDGRTVRACLPVPEGSGAASVSGAARGACRVRDGVADEGDRPSERGDVDGQTPSTRPGVPGRGAGRPRALVVGAGPGGLAAARVLADRGVDVVLLDRYRAAGGQIGRQPAHAAGSAGEWGRVATEVTTHPRVTVLTGTSVVALHRVDDRVEALVDRGGTLDLATADAVVLATGGREVVTPFPGWTLPGVVTAGAVQALVKSEGRTPWTRVGLAGSGPLLLAVAAALRDTGQPPAVLLEERPLPHLISAGAPVALRTPGKLVDLVRLVGTTPPRTGWRVAAAHGDDRLREVVVERTTGRPRRRTIPLDALGVSAGLVPDVALARQLGCAVVAMPDGAGTAVAVDATQGTSVPGVLAVGEVTGVGGAEKAVAEARVAGAALARTLVGDPGPSPRELAVARRWRGFAADLAALAPIDRTWADRAPDDVTVCRCEEVDLGAVRRAIADGARTPRAIKGLTRCGMGYCQGAVCSPLVRTALGPHAAAGAGDLEDRPVATPVPLDQLARLR